jgi:hypothetical protein
MSGGGIPLPGVSRSRPLLGLQWLSSMLSWLRCQSSGESVGAAPARALAWVAQISVVA